MTDPKVPYSKEQVILRDIEAKLKERKKALEERWYNVETITEKIVDSTNGNRAGLVAQRSADLAEADLIQAEVNILIQRRKVAYLAIYTAALEKAKQDLSELILERQEIGQGNFLSERAKRAALQEEIQGIPDRKTRDKRFVEAENEIATSHARALVNQQNIQRVKNTIRRYEMELEQAQETIAKW